jgi:hypothetical protein
MEDKTMQNIAEQMKDYINEKIQLLYDFRKLVKDGRKSDKRAKTVRAILKTCTTEAQIDRMVADITRYGMSIDQFIKLRGNLLNA